jgi:riboflavin kinase / FMN adenylyltransferase
MKIVSLTPKHKLNQRPVCLATVGVFDGIHKGHVYLINKLCRLAREQNLKTLLVSFYPHPDTLTKGRFSGYLTSQEEKVSILKALGLNYFWSIEYNQKIRKMPGRDFIQYLLNSFDIKGFLVGPDFKFGHKADKDTRDLVRICRDKDIKVYNIKKKKIAARIISSSYIRKLVKKSDFEKVRVFLGRDYSISGIVERGLNLGGKDLGIPTVNISAAQKILPELGVYLTRVKYKKKIYPGVSNLGFAPTLKKNRLLLETHIINFDKMVYEEPVEVFFLKKIRPEKKFSSLEQLREQIYQDIKTAKKIFACYHMLCLL